MESRYQTEKINALTLRRYFAKKYSERFGRFLPPNDLRRDLGVFKRLLNTYSEYVIMEAVDVYISNTPQERISVLSFCSLKTFEKKFPELVKLAPIMKFKRLLPYYGNPKLQLKIHQLIQQYQDIVLASSVSAEEVRYLDEILARLNDVHNRFIREED